MRYALKVTLLPGFLLSYQAFAGAILQTETKAYHVDAPAVGTTELFAGGSLLRVEINSVSSGEDGLVTNRGDRNEMIMADLISSRSECIDAAKFEPPEGYRRQEMMP